MGIEALKAFFVGVVEGLTEWLPISSTGHMILVDEFLNLQVSQEFLELFLVVIQIGAIMAVLILYFRKLNPFTSHKSAPERKRTWRLWGMVLVGCVPAAVIGLTLDDWFHEHFYNAVTVAVALIVYGGAFIVIELHQKKKNAVAGSAVQNVKNVKNVQNRRSRGKWGSGVSTGEARLRLGDGRTYPLGLGSAAPRGKHARIKSPAAYAVEQVDDINIKTALAIGAFQMLAIVPGTSRSGSTIIGGLLCGCSRVAASEFSFFLAIPVMLGWGLLKVLKYLFATGFAMSATEVTVLAVGIVTAFVVSVVAIKFLIGFVKKHSFVAFGVYRIVVGIVVLAFFVVTGELFVIQG
jgi:undecaprenyl-diphosphatase